jgi:hypothetical protein
VTSGTCHYTIFPESEILQFKTSRCEVHPDASREGIGSR